MKIKDELQAIYDEQEEVYYCCYCLEPQGENEKPVQRFVMSFLKETKA